MGVIKNKNASLPEQTLASMESSRIFKARSMAQNGVAPEDAAIPNAPQLKLPTTAKTMPAPRQPVVTLGDVLARVRAIIAGKVPFDERTPAVDEILAVLKKNLHQAPTELFGNCLVELVRGVVRREVPMNRHPHITQILTTVLDPRVPKLHPASSRKVVRHFASMIGLGLVPQEGVNSAAAVILFQLSQDHWSGKERSLVLEGLMWGMYNHGYSELFRSAAVGRVLRIANGPQPGWTGDELMRVAVPLSCSLSVRRVASGQAAEVTKVVINALKAHRGTVQERGLLALNIASYMNEDFTFTAPIEDLHLVADLPELDPLVANSIRKKILRQPESYYRSLSR